MARTVRDSKLETRAARDRLQPRTAPYWRTIIPGQLHLGYRRRRKADPGVWLVRHYLGLDAGGVGRYATETLGTADDYQDADGDRILSFAEAQAHVHDEDATRPARSPLTVADAINLYIRYLEAERATAGDVRVRAAKHILPELGALRVTELTTDRLRAWRDKLAMQAAFVRSATDAPQRHKKTRDERARKATANRTLGILKAALNRVFADGKVDDDLAWRRLKPFRGVHARRPGFLSIEDARRLINAADRDSGFRALLHGALLTGMRYSELAALRVRDFGRGKIHVLRSKSAKPRDVVLTDEGTEIFTQLSAGRAGNALIFTRHGLPWRKSEQARPMREACRRAKIEPEISFHATRHTWASHAVMNGTPLMVVATNLGHASTAMVERHYGHLAPSYVDEAVRKGAPRYGAVEPSNVEPLESAR
jgi:integrase